MCLTCRSVQVRRTLQSRRGLSLQAELGHVPVQFTWDHHRQLRWERQRLPRRRNTARDLQASRDVRSGGSDNRCEVKEAWTFSGSVVRTSVMITSISWTEISAAHPNLFSCPITMPLISVVQKIHRHGFYRQRQNSNVGMGKLWIVLFSHF